MFTKQPANSSEAEYPDQSLCEDGDSEIIKNLKNIIVSKNNEIEVLKKTIENKTLENKNLIKNLDDSCKVFSDQSKRLKNSLIKQYDSIIQSKANLWVKRLELYLKRKEFIRTHREPKKISRATSPDTLPNKFSSQIAVQSFLIFNATPQAFKKVLATNRSASRINPSKIQSPAMIRGKLGIKGK